MRHARDSRGVSHIRSRRTSHDFVQRSAFDDGLRDVLQRFLILFARTNAGFDERVTFLQGVKSVCLDAFAEDFDVSFIRAYGVLRLE